VLDGDPAPPPKKKIRPHPISAYTYCGQTTGFIRISLGKVVDLSRGDNMLDGGIAELDILTGYYHDLRIIL